MKKNQFLKRLMIFGVIALLLLPLASAATATTIEAETDKSAKADGGDIMVSGNFTAFVGWTVRMLGAVIPSDGADLSGYNITLNGTDSTSTTWNGLTIGVVGTQVFAAGTAGEQDSAVFTVFATRPGTEAVSEDVMAASFTVRIIGETTPLPSGAALDLSQMKIADKDGEHNPTYLRPLRQSVITIPVVEALNPDNIFGVYVRRTDDDAKVSLPDNSWDPYTNSDGYYYNTAAETFQINYYTERTGEYVFNIYYYQGGTLLTQQKILTGEIPGGDSGSGGCATGAGFTVLALAIGFCLAKRKR